MKYFNNTNIDTIGDWDGRENDIANVIDAILDKIDDMIIDNYDGLNIIIENAPEINNLVWDYVCNQVDVFDMNEDDYNHAAEYAFAFIDVFVVGD